MRAGLEARLTSSSCLRLCARATTRGPFLYGIDRGSPVGGRGRGWFLAAAAGVPRAAFRVLYGGEGSEVIQYMPVLTRAQRAASGTALEAAPPSPRCAARSRRSPRGSCSRRPPVDTLIPANILAQCALRSRHRRGDGNIIPDATVDCSLPPANPPRGQRPGAPQAAQRHLLDTKTIYAGTTYYTVGARAAEDQSGAVETRAARVHGDYRRHAEQLDQRIGMPGQPIQTRLESFGTVRGAVFGNYGEASVDVHSLLRVAAEMQARRMWRVMGARTWSEAFGFILQSMRRRLGVVVVREFARHRLHRVPYIGHTRASLARARSHAELQVAAMHAGPASGIRWEDFYAHQHYAQAGVARIARGW